MQSSTDFHLLLESLPDLYLVILPDPPKFTIVAVSNAYARQMKTKKEEIIGKGVFEVFPDKPNDQKPRQSIIQWLLLTV